MHAHRACVSGERGGEKLSPTLGCKFASWDRHLINSFLSIQYYLPRLIDLPNLIPQHGFLIPRRSICKSTQLLGPFLGHILMFPLVFISHRLWRSWSDPKCLRLQGITSATVGDAFADEFPLALFQSLHSHVAACDFECKCLSHLGAFAKSYHRMFYDFASLTIAVSTFVRI